MEEYIMKKRFIALILVLVLSFSMIACGSNSAIASSAENKKEETVATSTEAVVETEEPAMEEIASETVTEEPFVFTLDYGMQKVNMIKDAYNVLVANSTDKPVETAILHDYKNFISNTFTGANVYQYPNGDFLSLWGEYSTGALYLNNYINNGTGYYDFSEWLNGQDNRNIMSLCGFPEDTSNSDFTTDDVLMEGAFVSAEYLNSCTDISGELIESADYTIAGIQSAYVINLTCDGKTGGKAVFDAEGHLLNICMDDDSEFQNAVAATIE